MTLTYGKCNKQNFYDFGGKVEFEFKKICIAYEYIYRSIEISNSI